MRNREIATLTVNDESVVIRRSGMTELSIARVLSKTLDGNGRPTRLILDRRVHAAGITHLGEWRVHGAFCTVLEAESPQV